MNQQKVVQFTDKPEEIIPTTASGTAPAIQHLPQIAISTTTVLLTAASLSRAQDRKLDANFKTVKQETIRQYGVTVFDDVTERCQIEQDQSRKDMQRGARWHRKEGKSLATLLARSLLWDKAVFCLRHLLPSAVT